MEEKVSDNIQVDDMERTENFSREAQKFSWKKYALGWIYPLVCFIIVIVTTTLVKSSLDMTDLPLESELYNPKEGFSAARAHKHLVTLSQSPHGFESPKNNLAVEYIIDQVKLLQEKTDRISYLHDNSSQLALPQSDKNWIGEGTFSTYFITSNLLVKFKGTNSNGRAILLSAHYDTRPITPGASDAGIPVCVSLEVLEALIQSPPEGYDVMVNFNNGEEMGLLGSLGFKSHPWVKDVDSFINLEASGTGGKAFLFQSSSNSLVRALASGSYRHINGMSNDLFSMGIINSGTDYKVYKDDYNIPGVDIAIYRNRAFYHTTKDSLEHVSIASINQMGNFAYHGVKNVGKYGLSKETSKVIAFDFFGSSPVYNLTSFYVLIALFFVVEIILLIAYKLKIRHIQPLFTEGRPLTHILKGLLFSILTIIFTIIFGAIIIVITNAANKNVIHSWLITTFALMIIVSLWCQIAMHLIWKRWDRSYNINNLQMGSWLGTLILYNIIAIAQLATHIIGYTFLFFFILQAWAMLGSFIIYLLFGSHMNLANILVFDKVKNGPMLKLISNKVQPVISFFINYFFSAVIILGMALPLLYSVNQTAPTGTPSFLPYAFSLLFTTIICIPLSPNLLAMRHLFHIFILLSALLIIICPILWTRSPYSEAAPLPISYSRIVELDPISRKVTSSELNLKMNDKTDLVTNEISLESKSTQKESDKSSAFDVVKYDLDAPNMIDYSKYSPKVFNYTKSGDSTYQLQFEFNFPESKVCLINFPQPVTNLYVSHINSDFTSMQDPENLSSKTTSIRLMRNNNKLPWTLKLNHGGNLTNAAFEITSTCYEFNGDDLENVTKRIPKWISIWTRDHGQLGIKTKYTLKPLA